MTRDVQDLLVLAAAAVNETVPNPSFLSGLDYDRLYRAAGFHLLAAAVDSVLEKAGIAEPRFMQAYAKSFRKNMILDAERSGILSDLEAAGIWFMPLKGVVLKEYYPQMGMREMSDNDILFDASRADDVKQIMERRGFSTVHFGTGHQDNYQKEPLCNFEMHRCLFSKSSDRNLYQYYHDVDQRLLPGEGCERRFSREDFYLYMISHEYKHFYWKGTGLRSLLDTYVFLQHFREQLNWRYIHEETEKIGISDFEEANRSLALKVFRTGTPDPLTPLEREMLECFAVSGAFGTSEQHIAIQARKQGMLRYLFHRIFLPIRSVKASYPFFYRHKFLLPFLPLYRLVLRGKKAGEEIRLLMK